MSNLNNDLNSDSESSNDDLFINNNNSNDSDDLLTPPVSPRVVLTSVSSIDELDSPTNLKSPTNLESPTSLKSPTNLESPTSLKSPLNLESPPKLKSPFKLLNEYFENNSLNYNEYFKYKNSKNNEYKDNTINNDKFKDYKENNNNSINNISKELNILKLNDLKFKIESLKKRINLYRLEDNQLNKLEKNKLLKAEDIILNHKNMDISYTKKAVNLNKSNKELVKFRNVNNNIRIENHKTSNKTSNKNDPKKINIPDINNLNYIFQNRHKNNKNIINENISDLDIDTYSTIYSNKFTNKIINYNIDLLYTYHKSVNIYLKDLQNVNGYCLFDFFNLNQKVNIDGTFMVNLNDIIYLDDLFEVLQDEYFYSIKLGQDYFNSNFVDTENKYYNDRLKYEEYNFFNIDDKILNIFNKLQILSNTGFIIIIYLDISTFFNKNIYKFKNNMNYFKQNINNILSKYFNIIGEILLDLNKYYCKFNYLVSYQKDGFQIINCGINKLLFENVNSKIRYINNNMVNNNFLLGLHENINGKHMYKNTNFNATLNNNYKFLSLDYFTNFVNLSNVYIGMNYYITENTKLNNKLTITKKLQGEQKTKIIKELKEYKYNLFRNYTSLISVDELIDNTNILCINLNEDFDKQIIDSVIDVYKEKYCENSLVKTIETKVDKGDTVETKYKVTSHEVKLNIINLQVSELQELKFKNKQEEFEINNNTFSHKKKSASIKNNKIDKESTIKRNHNNEKYKEFDITSLFYIHNNKIIKRHDNLKYVEDLDDVEQIKKNTEKYKVINIIIYKDFTLHKCKQLFKYINTSLNLPPEEKYKIHFMNFKLNSWFRTCLGYYNYGTWFKDNNQIGLAKSYILNKHHYNKFIHFLKKIRNDTTVHNKIKMIKYSNNINEKEINNNDNVLLDESKLLCECCQLSILGNVYETEIKYLPYLDNNTINTMDNMGDFWNIRY